MTLATQTPRVCCATPARPPRSGAPPPAFESSSRQLRRWLSGYGLIVGLLAVAVRDMTTKPGL
jgi:hypothetical protein